MDEFAYIITSGAEHMFLPNVTAWVDDCNKPCEVSATFEECEAMDFSLELSLYKYMYNERLQQFESATQTFIEDSTTPDEVFGTKAYTNGLECGDMGLKVSLGGHLSPPSCNDVFLTDYFAPRFAASAKHMCRI